nr:methyl-accepting chemotaxis protein [uncultured Desulfobulbus sp.]
MSIRYKMLSSSMLLILFIGGIAYLTLHSFATLRDGFGDVLLKAKSGVDSAQQAETSLKNANALVTSSVKSMAEIAEAIERTNMRIAIISRKMEANGKNMQDMVEQLNEAYDLLPPGEPQYIVGDMVDGLTEMQTGIKREALVGIASAQKSMTSFIKRLTAESVQIQTIKDAMDAGQKQSQTITQGNGEIERLALTFQQALKRNGRLLSALLFIFMGGVFVGSFFVSGMLTGPINAAVQGLKDIAQGEGDLTKTLVVKGKDEVADLARWFNSFVSKLLTVIKRLIESTNNINASSQKLRTLVDEFVHNSSEAEMRSRNVAASTEELNANLNSVAAAMEEASTNISIVATATEELSLSLGEVAKNSETANQVSQKAVKETETLAKSMELMESKAVSINKVTETISEISEQTNLLALNATIEAARAGEAGKGFAVVANEIKELARQTASATQDINRQIEEIQSSTTVTVAALDQVVGVMADINRTVVSITSAVEEQSVATQDIALNIGQASEGISEVTINIAHCSTASSMISEDISQVNMAVNNIAAGSRQTQKVAEDLGGLAANQQDLVDQFKVG